MAMVIRRLCALALPVALRAKPAAPTGDEVVEIQFEPLGGDAPSADDLMRMLSGGAMGGSAHAMGSQGPSGREDLGSLFNSLIQDSGARRRPQQRLVRGGIMMGDMMDMPQGWSGPTIIQESSSIPASMIRDLFPAPMQVMEGGSMDGPDIMVANMMSHFGGAFRDDMLPRIHRSEGMGPGPRECQKDLKSMCNGTKSQLHCLGQHADNISEACRTRVGKSVPFLCGGFIDKWCDGLNRGILPCLADHLPDLTSLCHDAVVATHRVIAKVNTQRASMKDPTTGKEIVHLPLASPPKSSADTAVASAAASGSQVASPGIAAVSVGAKVVATAPPPASPPAVAAVAEPQGNSWFSRIQKLVLVGLLAACVYMLRYRFGAQVGFKGGSDLELNRQRNGCTNEHML